MTSDPVASCTTPVRAVVDVRDNKVLGVIALVEFVPVATSVPVASCTTPLRAVVDVRDNKVLGVIALVEFVPVATSVPVANATTPVAEVVADCFIAPKAVALSESSLKLLSLSIALLRIQSIHLLIAKNIQLRYSLAQIPPDKIPLSF